MKLTDLKKRLKAGEWNDVEFKEARIGLPKSAFEAVSAFANTHGGWLVFGVAQTGESYEICGVEKPDKIQSDFLSVLHADARINHDVEITEQKLIVGDKTVLIFHIAENDRTRKPVYLDGDIRRTFLRRGGCNFKAQMQDIERLLRDATTDRWDSQPFERVTLKEAFHPSSLRWYRDRFHPANPGFDPRQPDKDFLYHWGYLVKDGRRLLPTRGAVMLFGSPLAVHQLIPRPTLDVQFLGYSMNDPLPETRWIDRIVCEENIVQAWEQLLAKYLFFMPKPFRDIDPVTLTRRDAPPGFRVFREAAVNLLIHQDYGDHSRKAAIKFYRDGVQFWNPGDVFGDDTRLWEPGEKEVRNPSLAMAFRRIAMCEQAGTGLRMIREEWQKLGRPVPVCKNDRSVKAFEFFLPDGMSELTEGSYNDIGTEPKPKRDQEGTKKGPGRDQEGTRKELSQDQKELLRLFEGEHSITELQERIGRSNRTKFRDQRLKPLIEVGLIEMTEPEKPTSKNQRYRLTTKGQKIASTKSLDEFEKALG
ncbi:MAG: putative DNA binding domain-containing protein [Planctomycetaceae bacterium]|nr:putative DNA binding domain-containing protein [Planctomycetaceae bacterium]